MKLTINPTEDWKQILSDTDKSEVPIEVMEKVVVNLKDGSFIDVNIRELIEEGIDPILIEEKLNKSLKELDEVIRDVDFHINIESVIETVQPVTNKVLKDL